MKLIFVVTLLLALNSSSLAAKSDPLCVIDPKQMPESWRPSVKLKKRLNPAPWSKIEAMDAKYSIQTGMDEMIGYFRRKPSAIKNLGEDAIEALIQVTYASSNKPEFDRRVRDAARTNLNVLTKPFLKRKHKSLKCDDFENLLPLAIFAHRLYPDTDARIAEITTRTNSAYGRCGSLMAATGFDLRKLLAQRQAPIEKLFEAYVWAMWFIEAEILPDIKLPLETRQYGPELWNYFKDYHFAGASEFKQGFRDDGFVAVADLAPHIAHILTGTHRFPLYVQDAPKLYRFHRENFYAVLELGELDLFASIVDTLRQYGCTAENDVQVRDGTRFLLKIFHQGNDRWMAYRQDGETDKTIDDYGLVHYPWTSILGVRIRTLERPRPGNIGGVVRRWAPRPRTRAK